MKNRKYWYFTTHGIGPGTIPPGVHLLDVVEGQNKKGTWGDFLCLDAILNTSELRQYDLIELAPDNVYESVYSKNTFKVGDRVRSKLIKNDANMAFSGTIIDIDKDGLCTIDCYDGEAVDGIRQDRLVKDVDEYFISENLSTNDTKHNWFLCSDSYKTVEVLPEDKCNSRVIEAVYDDYVHEGIIDEDDETYWDENKFYKDFERDIIEAKYGVTKSKTGLKTPSDDYIIIKDSNYVGELPYGYYVDEDGDLLNKKEKVVGHVQNEPDVGYTDTQDEEDNFKVYRVWYLPNDPRERETFKDVHAPSKDDAKRQVSTYGLVTYIK